MPGSRERRADDVRLGEDLHADLALLGVHRALRLLRLVLLAVELLRDLEDARLDDLQLGDELEPARVVVVERVDLVVLDVALAPQRVDLGAHALHLRLRGGRVLFAVARAAELALNELVDEDGLDADVDGRVADRKSVV